MIFYQVADEILNGTANGIAGDFSGLVRIVQALGGVIAVYIIFNIIMVIINRKRNKKILRILNEVGSMKKSLKSINESLEDIKKSLGKKKK